MKNYKKNNKGGHMIEILGTYGNRGIGFLWNVNESKNENYLKITFNPSTINKRDALTTISNKLSEAKKIWLKPISSPIQEWEIDLDLMKKEFSKLQNFQWLTGKIKVIPEFEFSQDRKSMVIKASVNFIIKPEEMNS